MGNIFYALNIKVILLSKDQLELQLHAFCKKKTVNTSSRLERLRYQPRAKSIFNIPLCRMFLLPIVWFSLNDVVKKNLHYPLSTGLLFNDSV